ncbi:hypothetical protein CCHL11_00648 [Colletotrichum chlorophyti]|uniref:Uncharacterized protein n=1 Tax=Colletotrichum chlorophyti TaxID=708187 RepID=A0A1Q8S543_9PEZI|nr:hypothetical protein CCHL11_00648 [Colletotrichum chlorophyti]
MAPSAASSEGITAQSDLGDTDDSSSSLLDRSIAMDRLKTSREMPSLTSRSTVQPRGTTLSNGGIAGVVIGIVLFLALAVVCAYPFVIRRFRKAKKHGSTDQLDTETAFVPGPMRPQGQVPMSGPGVASRLSSKDSLGHKTDALRATERQSTKEMTLSSHNGIDHSPTDDLGNHHQRSFTGNDSTSPPSMATRHGTGEYSFGRAPTWKSEASYPWTPAGVELVATRADGMDYSEANLGQSATYYSPTVPSEAFGMITPPPTDEPQSRAPPRRSSSRGSSLKLNLTHLIRRMSTKDSASTRTKGLLAHPAQPVVSETISDSPTEMNGPFSRELVPKTKQLDSPIHLPSPRSEMDELDHVQQLEAKRAINQTESPPILPPVAPAPGTVNPMDIMAPSNLTEHSWHTNHQLYQMAHPPPKPLDSHIMPSPEPQPSQAPTPPSPGQSFEQQQLLQLEELSNENVDPNRNNRTQLNGWQPRNDPSVAVEDVQMNGANRPLDPTHLMPDHSNQHHYSEAEMTDPSDHSPPAAGRASSSGLSYQTTPNTQIDSSPSPRSEGSSDIRNSTSPYPGLQQSPRTYMCDECGRFFDQVHKLK